MATPGASGYGGYIVVTYDQPPNLPVFSTPIDGDHVPVTEALDVSLVFSSLAAVGSFPLFDLRWRSTPAGSFTDISGLVPVNTTDPSTGVVGAEGTYTFPPGFFTAGLTYELQARVYDDTGSVSDWGDDNFLAVAPPPAPVITAPVTEENSTPFNVTWTQASGDTQGEYEVQIYDPAGNQIYASGQVTSAVQSHSITWVQPSQEGLTLRVRYSTATDPDIWSLWATETLTINIDPPGVPTVTGIADDDNAKVTFTITAVDTPFETVSIDVYRTDLTHDEAEIRIAAALAPDPITRQVVWVDYTPANRTHYRYRLKANSAAGGFAYA